MEKFDVIVIGGGAAGLSAAVTLARSRRAVAVVDAGRPRNAPASGVHVFLSRDGMSPHALVAEGRAEVARYGGTIVDGVARAASRTEEGFQIELDGGGRLLGRRLLVASGLVDELPDVPGLRERWGRDVVHCPYCHGWEVRDRAIGVLATGAGAAHQALLFRQLSADVVLFAHTAPPVTGEEAARLGALGVRVVDGPVAAVEVDGDRITGLRLADGTVVPRDVVAVASRMVASSPVLESLGLRAVEHPMGVGAGYPAGPRGETELPGVWVAGNVTDPMAQVVSAAAQGVMAGAAINLDLVHEDADRAVAAQRSSTSDGAAVLR